MNPLHLNDILSAARTIAGTATRTPLVPAPAFAAIAGQPFLLKLETTQPTGAFKLRGALNALAHLPPDAKGVTCCSTGNHGRAVAYAARARGLKAVTRYKPELRDSGPDRRLRFRNAK